MSNQEKETTMKDLNETIAARNVKPETTTRITGKYAKLKAEFLGALQGVLQAGESLASAVKKAVAAGVDRETLNEWAKESGANPETARTAISRAFAAAGLAKIKPRKAKKPLFVAQGKALLAYAVKTYGENAVKVLKAAIAASK